MDLDLGAYFILAISSISVLGILMAGWASANKYSLVGGLRSSMGYNGAKTLSDLKKNAKLVKVTSAGVVEGAPHDLDYIEESA